MQKALVTVLTLLAACGDGDHLAGPGKPSDPDPTQTTVSFQHDIEPIFRAKCTACHYRGGAISLHLQDPFDGKEGLFNRINEFPKTPHRMILVPGKPDESFLYYKVSAPTLDHDTEGDIMPYIQPELTPAEVADVGTWIKDGAEDTAFFREKVAPVFGTALKLDERRGKCVWCHSAVSPNPPNLIDPFDARRGVVNKVSARNGMATLVVPGDPEGSLLFRKIGGAQLAADEGEPMPMHYPRLTDEELLALRTWISEGALEN